MQQKPEVDIDLIIDQIRELRSAPEDFDKITQLEKIESLDSVLAAARARVMVDFDRSQRDEQGQQGVRSRQRGRGIADQIALARRISPTKASRDLAFARALRDDLPATQELLSRGRISEQAAQAVHRETDHLDRLRRQAVDAEVASALPEASVRQAGALAKKAAIAVDPAGAAERARVAADQRTVWKKPTKDGMCRIGVELPAAQAIAASDTLRRDAMRMVADGSAEGRTQHQVMADLVFERLTGVSAASGPGVEVQLIMPAAQLFGQKPGEGTPGRSGVDDRPDGVSWLDGYGPIPAALGRGIAAGAPDLLLPDPAALDTAQAWVRRLFTDPVTGQLTGYDTKRRRFDGTIRKFIQLRDRVCRIPFCDAPIRDHDHVERRSDGGPTSIDNGTGVCQRFNLVKEIPGWSTQVVHGSGPPGRHAHTIRITTPTGKAYYSTSPPVHGTNPALQQLSSVEIYFTGRLAAAS